MITHHHPMPTSARAAALHATHGIARILNACVLFVPQTALVQLSLSPQLRHRVFLSPNGDNLTNDTWMTQHTRARGRLENHQWQYVRRPVDVQATEIFWNWSERWLDLLPNDPTQFRLFTPGGTGGRVWCSWLHEQGLLPEWAP